MQPNSRLGISNWPNNQTWKSPSQKQNSQSYLSKSSMNYPNNQIYSTPISAGIKQQNKNAQSISPQPYLRQNMRYTSQNVRPLSNSTQKPRQANFYNASGSKNGSPSRNRPEHSDPKEIISLIEKARKILTEASASLHNDDQISEKPMLPAVPNSSKTREIKIPENSDTSSTISQKISIELSDSDFEEEESDSDDDLQVNSYTKPSYTSPTYSRNLLNQTEQRYRRPAREMVPRPNIVQRSLSRPANQETASETAYSYAPSEYSVAYSTENSNYTYNSAYSDRDYETNSQYYTEGPLYSESRSQITDYDYSTAVTDFGTENASTYDYSVYTDNQSYTESVQAAYTKNFYSSQEQAQNYSDDEYNYYSDNEY